MVSLAAENYLFRHTTHPGAYCLGFFSNEDSTTILGGIVTRNMLVTYDREKNQIGFLRTKCTDLGRTWFADPRNDSSIARADNADNVWIIPPIPRVVSPRSPRNASTAPNPNSPKPQRLKNHSDPVDVQTSDASSSLPFLFSAPFMVRFLRHFHVPSLVILVNTFWK